MADTRVLGRRVGSMPNAAELALAHARLARRLSAAARRTGIIAIRRSAETNRALMNRYRENRTWQFSESRPRN